MSFRFPEIKFINNTEEQQIEHIIEELAEVVAAENDEDFVMECFDAIHAIETLIRIRLKAGAVVNPYLCAVAVIQKNDARGYYDSSR